MTTLNSAFLTASAGLTLFAASSRAGDAPKFNRDVRPILAENCFKCHGADSAARKSGLRLDQHDAALKGGESEAPAIVPGKPEASEIIKRLGSADPEEVMPPPKEKKQLTPQQVSTLRAWITDGAKYEAHWAFGPPQRPSVPDTGTERNAIDAFILDRLRSVGLTPSPEAETHTLCRRLSLDLTGLPPTPGEARAFADAVAKDRDAAVGELVDRLLASPRFGEHFAVQWLDLARYADTSGFQGDPVRTMWRWRDYVIESFNANKPFDQFTVEQIAGDLLPNATMEQRLATGFHRNHRYNTEFGSIDEEWKVENVVDRVEAVSGTWLGLTMGCGRCHDHKYDPITQRDFYSFFAFFNNVPERGVYWDVFGNYNVAFAPNMRAPLPADAAKLRLLEKKVADAAAKLRAADDLATEQSDWEKAHAAESAGAWVKEPEGLTVYLPLDGSFDAKFGERIVPPPVDAENKPIPGGQPTTIHFMEAVKITPPANAVFAAGALGQALRLDGSGSSVALSSEPSQPRVSFALWLKPEVADGVIFSRMGKQSLYPLGIELSLRGGRLHLEIDHDAYGFDSTMVPVLMDAIEPVALNEWTHLAVVLDGNRHNRGPTIFVNGKRLIIEPKHACARGLTTFSPPVPLVLGAGPGGPPLRGLIDDFRLYDRPISEDDVTLLASLRGERALARPAGQRSGEEQAQATTFYRDFISPTYAKVREVLRNAEREKRDFERTLPLVMVMEDKPTPPVARVLFRGQYDQPRDTVSAAVPAALGKLPADAPANRLGLARWLVAPENPLTARVFVNRLWERFFGIGLVKTSENLGIQADPPSHPELLDWLASEFVARKWDVKVMIKLIVTSGTYRQSSAITPQLRERDPENRLLARGPRVRLPAEAVRDSALAVSGLLVERVGGPSVRPYLPAEARGASPDLYRRSLYAVWERTNFNPSLSAFDASAREACVLKRGRTNTPLQALALLNEVTYVEAARKLAERMMQAAPEPAARLRAGFELALAREPSEREATTLAHLLDRHLAQFRGAESDATQLLAQGASKPDAALPSVDLAAYTLVASAILNLDEFITKE